MVLGRFLDTSDLENRLAASLVAKVAGYFSNQKSEDVVAFPNSSFHSIKGTGLFYSLSFLPTSEKTSIRYDLFGQGEKDYARISETLKDFLNGGIRRLERGYQK